MKSMVRVFLLLCLVAAVAACQSMGGAYGTGKFFPRLNLKVGDVFVAHESIRLHTTVPMGNMPGMEVKNEQNIEMDTQIEVTKRLPNNTWRLTYTITRFRNEMSSMGMYQSYDSAVDDNEANPLGVMVGHQFLMTLDEECKIVDFSGLDELFDKIIERVGPIQQAERQALTQKLRETLNEDSIKQNMLPNSGMYPDEPVTIGESWSKDYDLRAIVPMSGVGRYTLSKRENGRAYIDVLIDFTQNPNGQPLNLNGLLLDFDEGVSAGTLILDEENGMVVGSQTITDMTMSMNVPPEQAALGGIPDNLTMRIHMEHNYTLTDADQAETVYPVK
ncbi:MAG TPA: DUF6263 family protein [bacterium]|nr:DUF6263 family protein [bacterium]